jgi:hypothetical protein
MCLRPGNTASELLAGQSSPPSHTSGCPWRNPRVPWRPLGATCGWRAGGAVTGRRRWAHDALRAARVVLPTGSGSNVALCTSRSMTPGWLPTVC